MATLRLDIDGSEALDLIGIQCSYPDYRLAWTLNRSLDIHLKREEDFVLNLTERELDNTLFHTEDNSTQFTVFLHVNEDLHERFILVSNREQGFKLHDKARSFDYIMTMESTRLNLDECITTLNSQEGILTVARFVANRDSMATKPFEPYI